MKVNKRATTPPCQKRPEKTDPPGCVTKKERPADQRTFNAVLTWLSAYQMWVRSPFLYVYVVMYYQSLEGVPFAALHATFLESFADYLLPVQPPPAQLITKLCADGHRASLSVGVRAGGPRGRLVGLVLHGVGCWQGVPTPYNGGTGVIPCYRGRSLVAGMYGWIRDALQVAGVQRCLLEVLAPNQGARRAYEKVGFVPTRTLACFRGLPTGRPAATHTRLFPLPPGRWDEVARWQTTAPSWQNTFDAVYRVPAEREVVGLWHEEVLVAYAIRTPGTPGVAQLAVRPDLRRRGYGTALLHQLAALAQCPLVILNVDRRDAAALRFLTRAGLENFIDQVEMVWDV